MTKYDANNLTDVSIFCTQIRDLPHTVVGRVEILSNKFLSGGYAQESHNSHFNMATVCIYLLLNIVLV